MINTAKAATDSSLVGQWKFDEGKGDVLHDSSGNNNDGNIQGETWIKDDVMGTCLAFGDNTMVEVPSSDSLQLGLADFTIAAWIKTSSTIGGIATKGNAVWPEAGGVFEFGVGTGRLCLLLGDKDNTELTQMEIQMLWIVNGILWLFQ